MRQTYKIETERKSSKRRRKREEEAIEGEEAWVTQPFLGARAENTTKFTTGKNRQTAGTKKSYWAT